MIFMNHNLRKLIKLGELIFAVVEKTLTVFVFVFFSNTILQNQGLLVTMRNAKNIIVLKPTICEKKSKRKCFVLICKN